MKLNSGISLQDKYAPNSKCFGCGPKNPEGLRIKSFPYDDYIVAEWKPGPNHLAFSDFASGGIISVVLDCNGNWAAAYSLMLSRGLKRPPGTVTAEYAVRFISPTPMDATWHLQAKATSVEGQKVRVEGSISAAGSKTTTMTGLFIAVKESHPAFHRWQ